MNFLLHSHIEFFDRIKHNHGIIEELNVYQIGQVIDGLYGEDIRKNTLDIEDNKITINFSIKRIFQPCCRI